jgi:hypothetical protein
MKTEPRCPPPLWSTTTWVEVKRKAIITTRLGTRIAYRIAER